MNKSLFFKALLLAMIFGQTRLAAQYAPKVIPPSPNVAALLRYAEIPVDYSTGVPNIEIPIYTVESGKLKLPIKLTYHASGIKVRDVASSAGLGWVVQAGGVVSRSTLGKFDESLNGFRSENDIASARSQATTEGAQINLIEKLDNIFYRDLQDTQSDRYTYSFSGYTGSFRYDFTNGVQKKIPYRPIEISLLPASSGTTIQIIVEDGTKYLFEATEAIGNFSASYHLTKVISADNSDQIHLFYKDAMAISQFHASQRLTTGPGYNFTDDLSTFVGKAPTNQIEWQNGGETFGYSPKVLDYIVSNHAKVIFEYQQDDSSIDRTRLSKIKVLNKDTNEQIKEVSFSHSYFGTSSAGNLRRKLDAIHIAGKTGSGIETTSFAYNATVLPPLSNLQHRIYYEDYWGYYNGTSHFSMIPKEFLPAQYQYYGGNMNPDPSFAQACILEQIKYPTGGKTVFEYEPNRGGSYDYNNSDIVGGLRIKKITNYTENSSLALTKSYQYLGISAYPLIHSDLFHYTQAYTYRWKGGYNGLYWTMHEVCDREIYLSNSLASINPGGNGSIIYSSVRENIGEAGAPLSYTDYSYESYPYNNSELLSDHPRFLVIDHYDRGPFRANLTGTYQYKMEGGMYKLLMSTGNSYGKYHQREFKTGYKLDRTMEHVWGGDFQRNPAPFIDYLNEYVFRDTKGYEDISLLTSTVATDYSNYDHPVTKTTHYSYDNNEHLLVTKKEESSSATDKNITRYKYPHDFQSVQPYAAMVASHIWSPVVEELEYKNSTDIAPLKQTKHHYCNHSGTSVFYPSAVSTTQAGSYEDRYFLNYDLKGRLTEEFKSRGPKTVYIWSYKGEFPIGKVDNASYNTVVSVLGGTAAVEAIRNSSNLDVNALLASLRAHSDLKDARVTTYTYKPLLGMTSETDVKGRTTYYDYDGFGRLQFIRDHEKNVIKRFFYHYTGQAIGL